MTSAFHFMGSSGTNKGEKAAIEFQLILVPPQLTFTVYFMERFICKTLHSERFDVKSRAHIEDLESRRDWATSDSAHILGDVFGLVWSPWTSSAGKLNLAPPEVGARVLPSFGGKSKVATWLYLFDLLLLTVTGCVAIRRRSHG